MMNDDQKATPQAPSEEDGFELDSDVDENLEEAIQEALHAVEATVKPEPHDGESTAGPAAEEGTDERGIEVTAVAGAADEAVRLRQQAAEFRERSIRTLADFENYRKRVEREREQLSRYDGFEVLRELLDVVDNLERAVSSEGRLEDLKSGVEMILRQVEDLMRRHGVERVEASGQLFDPAVHEAVSRNEGAGIGEPAVDSVHQEGYLMRERLLRPAKVTVSVPAQEPRQPAGDPAGAEDPDRE